MPFGTADISPGMPACRGLYVRIETVFEIVTHCPELTLPARTLTITRLGMFAIVSDIHGNLEAFTVVLAEIERRGIQHIVCLGDIVGYGPNPMECLDLVANRCRAALMGNH